MKRINQNNIDDTDTLAVWRAQILSSILLFGVTAGFFIIVYIVPVIMADRLWGLIFWDVTLWAAGLYLLVRPGINYMTRAVFVMIILYGVGLAIMTSVGPLSGGPAWLFAFAVLSGVMLGSRAAIVALSINGLTFTIIGFLITTGKWTPDFPFFPSVKSMYIASINFLFLNALASISVSVLLKGLTRSHKKVQDLAASLKKEQIKLEAQIYERRLAETALKESEKKYRNILESIEDGFFEVDTAGNFTFFNDSMCRILKYERHELAGMNNKEYMDKKNAQKIYQAFNHVYRTGQPTKAIDWQLIRRDGTPCFVETVVSLIRDKNGKGIGFRGVARDVTERKSLETQLRQAHKMESIGRIAGGIAHDFNNILYIILGNTELAIHEISGYSPAASKLEKIKASCLRGRDIVKQLLNFSRETDQKLIPMDAVSAIREESRFLRSAMPATIEFEFELPDEKIPIMADQVQFNQVLMNICTNAAQAMGKTGGTIKISAEQIHITREKCEKYPGIAEGKHLCITIQDTGPGIDPENMDKIFDPYFTTKTFGKGSGMGLAVVHGIVKHHGGSIVAENLPGFGAAFHIVFPVINEQPEPAQSLPEYNITRGNETILFVDDEKPVADMAYDMLNTLGYHVKTSLDPLNALEVFRSRPDEFDLVIADMTMPRMNGAELAEELMSLRPDIPVILCTGYSELMDEHKAQQIGAAGFIMKPVSMDTLSHIVRKVLNRHEKQ